MSIKTTLLSLVILIIAMMGWWLMPPLHHPATQVIIINDRSDSTPADCASLTSIFYNSMKLPGINRHSTIRVLLTGDEHTANEPYSLAEYKAPDTRYIIEGKRRTQLRKDGLIADLSSKCTQSPVTKVSPIYLAVKRAVEQLQSMRGTNESAQYLFVKTDGEETADMQIKLALNQPPGSQLHLPNPIDNGRVRVSFCGMAETIGKSPGTKPRGLFTATRNAQRIDRAREVWGALFSNPSNVTFEPYCPNKEIPN